jgi:phenylpropionate dioxygenase-like ring-hydroxylating dioxygenase large terminal subunit
VITDVSEIVGYVDRGLIPAYVYSDQEVFELEKERVFGKVWMYLAHESEIPDPGDYVVRRILDDSFIVVRDANGQVRVLFNMCTHRGMQVCRAEVGNASHFRCPYHAWTFKNTGELVGLPHHRDAYGGNKGFRKEEGALLTPPSVDSYNGMIFASLDENAPSLDEYLGGFKFFLDFYTRQSEEGLEVTGPQRWRIKANWKIGAENFAGDTYHTPHTHHSVVEIGLFREPKASKRKLGALYFADIGGGTTYHLPPGGFDEKVSYVGYPESMIENMKRTFSPEQQAMVAEAGFMPSAATALPNLSFVHNWPQVNEEGLVVPFISIRQWQPVSATETEVYSWFAVDKNAPDWYKEASYKAYLMCFGSSGMFEQDDVENWTSITTVAKGQLARRLNLFSRMGLDKQGELLSEPLENWPGPGRAFTGFGEYNQRSLLRLWGQYMLGNDPVRAKNFTPTPL